MPVSAAAATKITTLAGLGTPDKPHPLNAAFIAEPVLTLSSWPDLMGWMGVHHRVYRQRR